MKTVIDMKNEKIQLLVEGETIECTPTNLGLTNDIYKGIYKNRIVAIRIPKHKTKDLTSFDNEHQVLPAIKSLGLDANELYYNPTTRIRITEWIDDAIEFKDFQDEDKILRSAKLIKKLHQAKLVTHNEFNGVALLEEYRSKIHNFIYPLHEYDELLTQVNAIQNPHILCHNDLVSGNLLFTKDKDYLIDYEYAKDNDPLFDIMSFFTENKITDEKSRECFYAAYFDSPPSQKTRKELSIYEAFHNLLWCTWANMMYDLLHEDIYKQIANDKYDALLTNIKAGNLN